MAPGNAALLVSVIHCNGTARPVLVLCALASSSQKPSTPHSAVPEALAPLAPTPTTNYYSSQTCSMRFERAGGNRSKGEDVVPTSGGDFDSSFHMVLAFDLAEIKFLFSGPHVSPAIG